jgi:hypothetical protein
MNLVLFQKVGFGAFLKGGVCIFVHKKYNYSAGDLSKYSKEQDIEACALKLELTALNMSQSTEHHVAMLIHLLMY